MKRICPEPVVWYQIYKRLSNHTRQHNAPPFPFVLAGWLSSNDHEKQLRWDETLRWATENDCLEIVKDIADSDFYFVEQLSKWPLGEGTSYLPYNFEPKLRPSSDDLDRTLIKLKINWSAIIEQDLASRTTPLKFTGKKARRLLVGGDPSYSPH